MSDLSLNFFGPIEVRHDGEKIDITARKALALLAYLAATERAQSRERVASLLWPEADERRARTNLRGVLWTLNQTPVEGWVEATDESVKLRLKDADVDVIRFEALVEQEADVTALAEGIQLYRGDFLDDFYLADNNEFEAWAAARRDHYRRRALSAMHRLAQQQLEAGAYGEAETLARRQIAIDYLRESAYRQLFLALAGSGQRSVALKEYEGLCAHLDEELGVAPSQATETVVEQIRAGDVAAEGAGVASPPAISEGDTSPPSHQREAPPASPYRGLLAFREEDAPSFFGREAITGQLQTAVRSHPLVALIGPSGSGKSSVAYAGLVASLRQEEDWLIASFRPGNRPFQALAGGLMDLLEPQLSETERLLEIGKLGTALATGELTLPNVVDRIIDKYQLSSPARLVLVVDQFEELYSSVPDATLRRSFLETLLDVVFDQEFRRYLLCTVVLTLRADFLGRALSFRPLADALQGADVKLGPMTRAELERAIVNPARKQGVGFAPGLVARILDDVGHEPGNLPLLSFTLDSLWELQEEGRLTHKAYEEIGKVQGALGRHADTVLTGLDPEEQALARRVFVQLVHPGEGTEGTRRLAMREELGDEVWQLVQRLADSRLLVTGRNATGQETVEVVHEALIRDWEQLQEWLEEDRTFRIWQEQLRASLHGWEAHNQDKGALLRGVALDTAQEWLESRPRDLNAAERYYISESTALREHRRLKEERAHAERERLRRTRTRILGVGLLVAALLAVLAGIQWWRAERQRQALADAQETILQERDIAQQALSGQLAAEVEDRLDSDLDLALLLAVEANRRSDNPAAHESLVAVLNHTPRLRARTALPGDALHAAAFAPDGRLLATGGESAEIQLWQIAPLSYAFKRLATLTTASDKSVRALAFSPDGRTLAAVQLDALSLYDLAEPSRASREILLSSAGPENGGTIADIAFGPDGEFLAIGVGNAIQVWDLGARRRLRSLAVETGNVSALAFAPDGERIVAGSDDGALLVWHLDSGESRRADVGIGIFGVAVSPEGAHIAVAGQPELLELWQLDPLLVVAEAEDVEANILFDVAFHADGRLVSAGSDGHLVLWQVDGEELVPEMLPAHDDTVRAVTLDDRGRRLAAADLDGLITLWNAEAETATGLRLQGHAGAVQKLAFLEDQRLASLACQTWTAFVLMPEFVRRPCTWMETGLWQTSGRPGAERLLQPDEPPVPITGLALTPDEAVAGYEDGSVPLWDVTSGRQTAVLEHQQLERIVSFAFDPGSDLMAAGGCLESNPSGSCREGGVRLWQREQRQAQRLLRGVEGFPSRLALSPGGRWLASSVLRPVGFHELLWDLNQEEPQPRLLETGEIYVMDLAFHPHENLLATGDFQGVVKLWQMPEAETGDVVGTLDGSLIALAFSPDGRYLAMAGCASAPHRPWSLPDCTLSQLEVLDRDTGRLLARPFLGHSRAILSLAFNGDGSLLASGDFGGDIILWDLSASPEEMACRRAGRNLTQQEWERYFGEEPYRPTCPDMAIQVPE